MLTIAVDSEVSGLDTRHIARPFFLTITHSDNPSGPVNWRWDVCPLTRKVVVPIEDLVEIVGWLDKADEIVFQNSKFDISALVSVGLKWKTKWWDKVNDTLYTGHLLASGEEHNLTAQALKYLRIDIQPLEDELERVVKECTGIVKREFPKWMLAKEGMPGLPSLKGSGKEDTKKWKHEMWLCWAVADAKKLPANHLYRTVLADYSNCDSGVTLPLWLEHKRLLQENGNWPIYLEARKLLKVVYEMESRGVTYSATRLDELLTKFSKQAIECEKACIAISGGVVDKLPKTGTTKLIRKFLFDICKIPVLERSEKTQEPTVDKDCIEAWLLMLDKGTKAHTFLENLSNNRQCNTACSYMNSYKRFGVPIKSSSKHLFVKLHPSLNVTGTNTLRGSSERPNSQNISAKSYANIRYCFGPIEGREWWSFDFKNLERFIPAYEAKEQKLIDLFEKPDEAPYYGSEHLLNASIVYPDEFWECVEKGEDFKKKYKTTLYHYVKCAGFALAYNAMESSGTVDRSAHKVGAHAKIKTGLPNIEALNQEQIKFANKHGYVLTISTKQTGRGYPLQLRRGSYGRVKPTLPMSYHIQSTAMDCTRRAMVRVADYLDILRPKINGYITLQIHDELVVDLPLSPNGGNLPIAKEIQRQMELSGSDINIPLKVERSYHPSNWGEEQEVK